ncbi:MAG: T9SS type A sorting domain-containing protein [Bacteroidetes bacterium]|nr:T9SS type A sorting domain-containing protein [Bacteroidota bacterium]
MKQFCTFLLCVFFGAIVSAEAQSPKDFAVMINATTQKTPKPSITIGWEKDKFAKHYSVYRRLPGEFSWGNVMAELDSTVTKYTDNSIEIGTQYEYQILKKAVQNDTTIYLGTGYVVSGIEVPPAVFRGKVLLLIDSTIVSPLSNEINRLEKDLKSEAWSVVRRYVSRTEAFNGQAVKKVKSIILEEYNNDKKYLKSVLLLGRVAVPYSGNLNPDGHPDHLGAWPADCYYGDIDGNWTDKSVNSTVAGRAQNKNIPNDGKFDQTGFDEGLTPIAIELQVGRVDFYDMPSFRDTVLHKTLFDSELALLKRYLDKNHAYRSGAMNVKTKGWIADNFGSYGGDMFANSGWRNFSALLSDTNVKAGDYFTGVADTNVLWAYGCGGGSFTSCGGVGSTSDFVVKPVNAVFTMLFGSYFGDWDSQNNIMRAVLASKGSALSCSWAGRPQWYYHNMGMGESIGYSTVLTQNNYADYIYRGLFNQQYPDGVIILPYGTRWVHNALLGDPTLRMNLNKGAIPKPDNIEQPLPVSSGEGSYIHLNWNYNSPNDEKKVDGYFIYRLDPQSGNYIQINTSILKDASYTDTNVVKDKSYSYFVRGVALCHSATGSYYDMSDSISINNIQVPVGVDEGNRAIAGLESSPIPAVRYSDIHFSLEKAGEVQLEITDISGNKVNNLGTLHYQLGEQTIRWDLTDSRGNHVSAGIYLLTLTQDKQSKTIKIVVAN